MAYTPEQRAKALDIVIAGLNEGTPLAVICRGNGIPSHDAIRDWADADAGVKRSIARARETGFDAIAARCRETARGEGDSKADVQRDKLIIDTDLKLLAKWDKRYADKTLVGSDPDNPLPSGINITYRKAGPDGD